MFAQECAQSRRAYAAQELPQSNFDDGTLAHAAAHGDTPQFVAYVAGEIYGDTLRAVGMAHSR